MEASARSAVVKATDMAEDMQHEAIEVAVKALDLFNTEKEMASFIKREFDKRGPFWHCAVGRNFGSFVTHETKCFTYFYIGQTGFLIFKSQSQV